MEGTQSHQIAGRIATVCAALMIAQQIGSKAVRDALFLGHFPAEELPKVMIAAAALSLLSVVAASQLMKRLGPARFVPFVFGCSAAIFLVEWIALARFPRLVAVVVYLHIATFGATAISGFWSVINERFDPHSAKHITRRIVTGATFGGVFGALAAERLAQYWTVGGLLTFMAALNIGCAVLLLRIEVTPSEQPGPPSTFSPASQPLRDPFLRVLAVLVLSVGLAGAFADYAIRATAAAYYRSDQANLLTFFAYFYGGVSLATFALQSALSRISLEKLGLGWTLGTLPGGFAIVGAVAIAIPTVITAAAVRGVGAVLENSLFRSSYEVLYTPVEQAKKRASKVFIDVAMNRLGDGLGGAAIMLILFVFPNNAVRLSLVAVVLSALLCMWAVRSVHRGYVNALAAKLQVGLIRIESDRVVDATTKKTIAETNLAIDRNRLLEEIEALRKERKDAPPEATAPSPPGGEQDLEDGLLQSAQSLLSNDPATVRAALHSRPDPRLAPLMIHALRGRQTHDEAYRALRKVAPFASGAIVDAMLGDTTPVRLLPQLTTLLTFGQPSFVAAGMHGALDDERFVVRYWASQVLLRLNAAEPIKIAEAAILKIVQRELDLGIDTWQAGVDIVRPPDDRAPFLDHRRRTSIDARLEYVFALLALTQPAAPLHRALRALHTGNENLEGSALQYLESRLPPEIRADVWTLITGSARITHRKSAPHKPASA